ncbi:MAG: superoxide dismutase [Terriglobales bacterium]|jgi:Fe-Mn family superoxide dismutase
MAHELPPLPYDYSALDATIDTQTMHLHHDMHHAAYVKNLNAALEKHPELQSKSAIELVKNINSVPEDIRTAVRNNGGGHVNHTMFWEIMKPNGGGAPHGAIGDAVNTTFGGLDNLKQKFNDAGVKQFGSGWVWVVSNGGRLEIISTANQDSPFMQGHYPIFGNDVWEHAYYLKYHNRRADYLAAWWNVVNWDAINKRLQESQHASRAA